MAKPAGAKAAAKVAAAKPAADPRSLARSHTETAIAVLAAVMNDAGATPASRVRAAETLLDRGWGRSVQATEITGPEGRDLSFTVRFVAASGSASAPGRAPVSRAGDGDDSGIGPGPGHGA